MAGDEPKHRRRRKHSTKSETRSTVSTLRPDKLENGSKAVRTSDHSVDNDNLREARLDRFERKPENRRSKVESGVYERDADRDQKYRSNRRYETRQRKDKHSITGTKSKVEPPNSRPRTRSRDESSQEDTDSEEEYVYGRPGKDTRRKPTDETTTTPKPKKTVPLSRSRTGRTLSGKVVEERRVYQRRHTEPSKSKITVEVEQEAKRRPTTVKRTVSSTIPRKAEVSKPPLKRSATTTKAMTEVSVAKTSASANPRRSSGLFGSLLPARPAMIDKKISCLTCGADDVPIFKSAKLPCTHRMCHSCLRRIFKLSLTDPAHMPPRCCTNNHIDLKHVDKLFDQDFKKAWNRKFLEWNTKNRIYCCNRNCGEWIKPNHISMDHGRKVGKCKRCGTRVCAICNNKMHASRDCPKDPAMKEFVKVAKEKGWQRCYSCNAMVELKEGCNHMTCRCTAEFCMVCGSKWKSCDCPWFNYTVVSGNEENPVRYQEEIDRRRDQEQRDEALARRMEVLELADTNNINIFGIGNAGSHHMNQNFIQQARDAIAVNYQQAEQAARGLLNGFVTGRENTLPGIPGPIEETVELLRRPTQRQLRTTDSRPTRRSTLRRQSARADMVTEPHQTQRSQERSQERRIRDWANDVATS